MKINVIKVGGAVVENADSLSHLLQRFAQLEGMKILVHGGGRSATTLSEQLGIPTTMVGGRRITDAETLRVVTMVYGGLVNKQIVTALQALGINAVGLTGADLNCIQAIRRPIRDGIDYGYVGDVYGVNAEILRLLLTQGIMPVIAPLTHDQQGQMLNTNADTIAAEVAKALAQQDEVTLTYCFEKKGVLSDPNDEDSVIPAMDSVSYDQLRQQGVISGGMLPKLDNAFSAIRAGVQRVVITSATTLGDQQGTIIS